MKAIRYFLAQLCALALVGGSLAAADKPNIIVILVDDMGFSDIGCYGSEIPTPNLDALAVGGLRFTQFYNTGRCCPTRAALLTGIYSHQAGVGHMTDDKGVPGYQGHLNDQCATFAEVLKPAGYFTAMTGKWHVGQNLGVTPWGRGFERSLNAAAGGFYQAGRPNAKLFLNGEALADDDVRVPKNWYSTDLWTTFGLKFIDEARQGEGTRGKVGSVGDSRAGAALSRPCRQGAGCGGAAEKEGAAVTTAPRYSPPLSASSRSPANP